MDDEPYVEPVQIFTPERTSVPGALPRLRRVGYPPLRSTPLVLPPPPPEPSRIPRLPNEILALIIDFVPDAAWGWREVEEWGTDVAALWRLALTHCCLASKALLYPARRCLYGEVDVTHILLSKEARSQPEWKMRRAQFKAISEEAHLRRFVRCLTVGKVADIQSKNWRRNMISTLRHLPSLRRVHLDLPALQGDTRDLVKVFTSSCPLLHTLSVNFGPSVKSLGTLGKLLRAQNALKRLSLVSERPGHLPLHIPLNDPPQFRLENLTIIAAEIDARAFDSLTRTSSASLVTLFFDFDHAAPAPLSLAHFTALQRITLSGSDGFDLRLVAPDLPLTSVLELEMHGSPVPESILDAVPPNFESLSWLGTKLTFFQTMHLLSSRYPNITSLEIDSAPWSLAEQMEVARACQQRGLRLEMPDPARAWDQDGMHDKVWRENHEAGLQTLEELNW